MISKNLVYEINHQMIRRNKFYVLKTTWSNDVLN
jgi:hypothetical protein